MNKMELCKTIQANVSKLTDNENLELFKIILDTNANYTKNNNGVFLNLNWIDEELLIKINNYISFCIKSQNEISKYELMKTLLNESINAKETNGDDDYRKCYTSCVSGESGERSERGENGESSAKGENGGDGGDSSERSENGERSESGANCDTIVSGDLNNASNDNNVINGATSNIVNQKHKFSSSMKFYLLKKKFMKQNISYAACIDNDLTYEDYLIT
jgi:hypothetical protein